MKRQRQLRDRVSEIVEEGKSRDRNGRPVYPEIATDPLVLGLFGAPEALFEVLRDRPVIVLNLLQTNKAVKAFWDQFDGIWILLIESLIEKAWPMANSIDVYPFFAITNQRIYETIESMFRDRPRVRPAAFLTNSNRFMGKKLLQGGTAIGQDPQNPSTEFVLIYYDEITKLIVEICQNILALSTFFPQSMDSYLYLDEYLRNISINPSLYVVCLDDAFLMKKTEAPVELKPALGYAKNLAGSLNAEYSNFSHGPLLSKEVEITYVRGPIRAYPTLYGGEAPPVPRIVGIFPLKVGQSLSKVLRSIDRLSTIMRRHTEGIEPIVDEFNIPVPIDRNLVRPYRDLLYHPTQGLYNTPDKQKGFFISLLDALGNKTSKEEVIERFGQPLACTICQCETHMVDPVLNLAFCETICRTQYKEQ